MSFVLKLYVIVEHCAMHVRLSYHANTGLTYINRSHNTFHTLACNACAICPEKAHH